MLRDVLRFEWRYHTRQISFAAAAAIFFVFGLVLAGTGFGPKNINVNAPFSIFESLGLASLATVFVVAVFCAHAVVRDREYQMEEIVFTTAVGKFDYLFGRFLGSFIAAFLAFAAIVPGMLLGILLPGHDQARVGAIHLGHYLWPLLVLVLPNMLLAAALLFAIATLTRSLLASVVGAVFLYVLYFVAAALTNSPLMAASTPGADSFAAASLLDPFGLSAFFAVTRTWTAIQRNTQLVPLAGAFLWNRVVCVGAAAVVFGVAYRLFAFRRRAEWRTGNPASPSPQTTEDRTGRIACPPLRAVPTAPSQLRALLSATRLDVRSFALSLPFLLLTLMWIGLAFSEVLADLHSGEYGSASIPTMGLVLSILQQPLLIIASIVIIYYSGELVWRERVVGMAEIVGVTPASARVLLAAKWLALCALVAILIAAGGVVAAVLSPIQPAVLLAFLYFAGVPLLLLATLAVLIHARVPHKYAGMLLVLLVAVVLQKADAFGLPFGPASVEYSEMNGFSSYALWRIDTRSSDLDWRATYEKRYARFEHMPQPRIAGVAITADLYPRERRYRVKGTYRLVNDGNVAIDTILVSFRRDIASVRLPLQPGQSATVPFVYTYVADGDDTSIVANGTYIARQNLLPMIGYRESLEIRDERERKKRGLATRVERNDSGDVPLDAEWIDFDAVVSTDGDQTAVAPGRLVRTWTDAGRRHFHFRSDAPINNVLSVMSARYAVARAGDVEVLYDPRHAVNVPRMLKAANDSLRLFSASFAPYPQAPLRIAEVPAYNRFGGYANPGVVALSEYRAFLIDARDPRRLDLVSRRVAHEVAHQWWGHWVTPADADGAPLITETLAKYSELLLLEHTYGQDAVRESLERERNLYLAGRATGDPEVPLTRVTDQSWLYYRKGAVVLWAIHDLLGEETLHRALRAFVAEQGGPGRHPRAADLVAQLHAVATLEQRAKMDAWLAPGVMPPAR